MVWEGLQQAQSHGTSVWGVAISATGAGAVVDVDGVQGFVRRRDMLWAHRSDPSGLVGRRVEGVVLRACRESGELLIAPAELARARCSDACARRRRVSGVVVRANAGGLVIDVGGIRGFLPRSRMTRRMHWRYRRLVGRRRKAYVVGVSRNEVVLSALRPGRPASTDLA